MKKWIIVVLVFFVPLMSFYVLSKQNGYDFDMQTAHAAGKPTVYKFSSTMCIDCQELEKVVAQIKPEYSGKINFISYKVDNPDRKVKNLIKKYKIKLVPTMILADKDGIEKLKIEGLVSKEILEQHLKALINE